jgi:diguanylate cyclase (GGDEF)-like protein
MLVTAAASGLLAVHWSTAFMVIHFVPSWSITGFMLGTFLVLIQYLSLLAAILRSLQQRLLEAEAKALDMAFQDPLTGLSNRRYVNTLFDKVLALAKRPRQLVAVIYIDLDDFKPINDRAGHKVGDEVLRVTAGRLKQATRSTDICARLGGDEFVAICTQLDEADQVHVIVDKIMSSLTAPIPIKGEQYGVGASIGISLYPLHGDSLLQLVEHADVAMYQVKQSGKSGYRIYEETPNPPRTPVAAT